MTKLPENSLLASERRPVVTLTQYKDLVHEMMPKIYDLFTIEKQDAVLAGQMAKTTLLLTFREL